MVGFKKKTVSLDRVAEVELVAASAPIVGDPRIGGISIPSTLPVPLTSAQSNHLGSRQDSSTFINYEVGRVYEIPLYLIKSNPYNPRAIYTASAIDEMAASLKMTGQRIAATAYISDQGDPVLIEGETRLRGARAAELPTLRVEIRPRPPSDRELYEEARAANVERREQTPLDDAIRWKELLTKKIYPTQVALSKAMKVGEDYVSRTLSLAALPNRVVHACAEHPNLMQLRMLNAIREFFEITASEEKTIELIFEVAKTGMGYRDVLARRKAAAKGPIKRPRASREILQFKGSKGEFKTFEEDGRVELLFKGLSAEIANEIVIKIKAIFQNT